MYGYAPIRAEVLAIKLIPNINPGMAEKLELKPHHRSLGLLTLNVDDIGYVAVDEATKKADVDVVYARSFYCGAAHASGPLSGEFIAMLAGPDPAEVKAGIQAACDLVESPDCCFYTANEAGSIAFFAYTISRTGSYLAGECGIPVGSPLSYLIAPPIESMYAVDAAIKASDVQMVNFFGPPSETNFGGAQLTGSQSACKSACDAFAAAVMEVARYPKRF